MKKNMQRVLAFFLSFTLSIFLPKESYAQSLEENLILPVSPARPANLTDSVDILASGVSCSYFSMAESFLYVFNSTEAAQLGFPFFGGELSENRTVIVQEYSLFNFDDKDQRVGVGVRHLVTVNEEARKVGLMGISGILAEAERGKLEATIHLQILGISNSSLPATTPVPSELNFTTLTQMYRQVDEVKRLMCVDDETTLIPLILAEPRRLSSQARE